LIARLARRNPHFRQSAIAQQDVIERVQWENRLEAMEARLAAAGLLSRVRLPRATLVADSLLALELAYSGITTTARNPCATILAAACRFISA